jgi:hypothetical protein
MQKKTMFNKTDYILEWLKRKWTENPKKNREKFTNKKKITKILIGL